MPHIYRIATPEDKEQLQTLGLKAYGQFEKVLTEKNWHTMDAFLRGAKSYTDLLSKATCFVCEAEGKLIGMAFVVRRGNPTDIFDSDWSYIRMVGVDPAHGGQGIGKNLTRMCVAHARESGEKIIALHTSELMDTARHIYEHVGFEKMKEIAPLYGTRYWLYQMAL